VNTARRRSTGSAAGQLRKEEIVRASAKVFAEKGFAAATVRDVAHEAGTLSGSMYYYFPSKESMVEELLVRHLDEMIAVYRSVVEDSADAIDDVELLIAEALRGMVRKQHEMKILLNDWHYVGVLGGVIERQREIEALWVGTIQRGIDSERLRADFDAKMMYRMLMGAVLAVGRWYRLDGPLSIDEVIKVQTGILLDGIRF
jgi:AcrR family transcriptional regulator